ncbi:MAG: hypothetical protein IT395_00965 [Candidatus Omnitrophica bacterium]|nr:hypothetical protein [Candidatus Omnitrophota bacterium]
MKNLVLLVLFAAISSTAFAKVKDVDVVEKVVSPNWDKWVACETTVDCVVVVGVCGTLEAINQSSVQEHEAYVEYASQSVRCVALSKDLAKDKPPVVCVQKQCALLAAQ